MPRNEQMCEYLSFLLWFGINYPEIDNKYWQNITVPKKNEGVGIHGTDIPAIIYDQLVQIQYNFYIWMNSNNYPNTLLRLFVHLL